MKILCFGGGEIWEKGIQPVVGGEGLKTYDCDVRERGKVYDAVYYKKPDVVIFTAGLSEVGPVGMLWGDDEVIRTNLIGAFNVAFAASVHRTRTMIFLASVAGKYGKPNHAAYCASKAGVISLVQSLAMEGHNAYAISPGRVNTAMRHRDYPNERVETRLDPLEVGHLVKDILDGKYEPGDNLIIRRIGTETQPIRIDRGEPWKEDLKVGQPPVC